MDISVETLEDGITRVSLAGRMDHDGTAEIVAALTASVHRGKGLLVDLSKVTFIASMGMRALLTTAKTAREHGGRMVLFQPELSVAEVLKASGTDTVIPVYDDLKLARSALQRPD